MSGRHRRLLPVVDDSSFAAPRIEAATAADRPRFSVMIPTYNCAELLRVCLASVLRQDPGPSLMQIEVIDDCSTRDDPEAVVKDLGGDRVIFTRQSSNVGAVANFNECIRRAQGEFVHILHGDDFVHDGFYAEIDRLVRAVPNVGVYATRVDFVDEVGTRTGTSVPLDTYRAGSTSLAGFASGCPLQFAGTVVRRAAYEEHGGFLSPLIHSADYEMWMRITARAGLAASAEPLAAYRKFAGQHTSTLRRTAENLADVERVVAVVLARGDALDPAALLRVLRTVARVQAARFRRAGDIEAEQANLQYWRVRATWPERLRHLAGRLRRTILHADGDRRT